MPSKSNPRHALKLQRQAAALEMRRMGKGYVEIGNQLGIGKSQAHRLVQAALEEARAQIEGSAQEIKSEELSRLDAMLSGLWPEARKGNQGAVDRVLKIMERRAKLLGLDAPVRLAHGGDKDAPPQQHEHHHKMTDAELELIAAGGSA